MTDTIFAPNCICFLFYFSRSPTTTRRDRSRHFTVFTEYIVYRDFYNGENDNVLMDRISAQRKELDDKRKQHLDFESQQDDKRQQRLNFEEQQMF